jgi:hypothetical protein
VTGNAKAKRIGCFHRGVETTPENDTKAKKRHSPHTDERNTPQFPTLPKSFGLVFSAHGVPRSNKQFLNKIKQADFL